MKTKIETHSFKSTTKKILAHAYNVTDKTLNKWLSPHQEQIGEYLSRCYTPRQIETIVSILGMPERSNLICV
ncbi:hypothetical protein ABW636_14060 [Aquimarina sp. 2201CG1-2-11]|uniref:hypothetical protein n=1 Tax=Aquimarina discodermiae TaxID=3231043 RepID=UPI0034627392